MKRLFTISLSILMLVGFGTDVALGLGTYKRPDWLEAYLSGKTIPKPAKGNLAPHYPELAKKLGIEGKVVLRVEVDSLNGQVTNVSVNESSGYLILDEAAISAVQEWRYIPVEYKGKMYADPLIKTFIFSLTQPPVKLMVTSNPSNALIYIDRVLKGVTPLSIELPPASYELRLESKDHQVHEEWISLGDGKTLGTVKEYIWDPFKPPTVNLEISLDKKEDVLTKDNCYFKDEIPSVILGNFIAGVMARASQCDSKFGGNNVANFYEVLNLHKDVIQDWETKLDKVPARFSMTKYEYAQQQIDIVRSLVRDNPQLFTSENCAVLPDLFEKYKKNWDNVAADFIALYLVADQHYTICN